MSEARGSGRIGRNLGVWEGMASDTLARGDAVGQAKGFRRDAENDPRSVVEPQAGGRQNRLSAAGARVFGRLPVEGNRPGLNYFFSIHGGSISWKKGKSRNARDARDARDAGFQKPRFSIGIRRKIKSTFFTFFCERLEKP